MFQRAAAAAVSSAILVGCLPPEEQHWVVREVVDVCAPFDPADFESTWRGERIEVEGDTEQAFRASFGGIAGDCSEPSGDLRTCSFDMPIVSTNRNGTETTTPCSFVVSVERDRFAPIGSDLGIATEDAETAGWLALVTHVFPQIVPVIAAFWGLDEVGAFDELFTSPGLGYGMY